MQIISTPSYAQSNVSRYHYPKSQRLDQQQQEKSNKSDTVTISLNGKQLQGLAGGLKNNNRLDSLLEQKQQLIESKNEYLENASKNGTSIDEISERLKSFEEQMATLEEEISKQMIEERQENLDLKPKEEQNNPSLNEDPEMENLTSIINQSNNMNQLEGLTKSKNQIERQVKTIQSEIKQDGFSTNYRKEKLSDLNQRLDNISKQTADVMMDVTKQTKESSNQDEADNQSNVYFQLGTQAYKQTQENFKNVLFSNQVEYHA